MFFVLSCSQNKTNKQTISKIKNVYFFNKHEILAFPLTELYLLIENPTQTHQLMTDDDDDQLSWRND